MTGATDWTGQVGQVWAAEWQRTDRSFAGLDPHLNAAILRAATGAARIVDIGTGAGTTALAIATACPAAAVTGIDLSPDLVAVARTRNSACPNLVFVTGDAIAGSQALAPVDLYVSRHGVMFFADPVAAFAALGAAATPDARLVFSCFADRAANPWATETRTAIDDRAARPDSGPGPFAFADPAHVSGILNRSGWHPEPPLSVAFGYQAGQGADPVADAVDFFRRIGPAASALRTLPPAEREAATARLTAVCARHRRGDTVVFPAAAWIWTAAWRQQEGSL